MQENQDLNQSGATRVQNYRERTALGGLKRVEVQVSIQDEWFIRAIAKILRSNKKQAMLIRSELFELLPPPASQGIVEFFGSSPLADAAKDLDFKRSKDTGTSLQF